MHESPDFPHLELGHALITMVEPEPATVVEYNTWYERDHFLSGVLAGPGAFAGRRWVATKALKAERAPIDSPLARPTTIGTFVTLYWIERDQLKAHCDWGFPEAVRLAGLGRMRSDRQHVSTAYYDLVGSTGRGGRPVPIELALHHPYSGLVMIWTSGGDHGDAGSSLRRSLAAEGSAIGAVVTFRPTTLPPPYPPMPGAVIGATDVDPDSVLAHCCFVDTVIPDPAALRTFAEAAVASSGLTALLIAPFIPVVAGVDPSPSDLW
ncbi:MAG: hypothetical protein JWL72_76 [Ilumatobacteraceae bacterium]|nr:hypothetical protein [Ilumatobacteraceae bacterium]